MVFSMIRNISTTITSSCLFGAVGATPVPVNLGTLDKSLSFSPAPISGEFDDVLYFQADDPLGAVGTVVGLNGGYNLTCTYRFESVV